MTESYRTRSSRCWWGICCSCNHRERKLGFTLWEVLECYRERTNQIPSGGFGSYGRGVLFLPWIRKLKFLDFQIFDAGKYNIKIQTKILVEKRERERALEIFPLDFLLVRSPPKKAVTSPLAPHKTTPFHTKIKIWKQFIRRDNMKSHIYKCPSC